MQLRFQYDIEKDVENWIKATKSVNNPKPTKMHILYVAKHGDVFDETKLKLFIKSYLEEKEENLEERLEKLRIDWEKIQNLFLERAEDIFSVSLPMSMMDVFLTTDNRATYNTKRGYFFVSIHSKSPMRTIMHELFHFFTWYAFHEELEGGRISKECYNDIKESFTVLLNIEFPDLLGEAKDEGYPQHQEMRKLITEAWAREKNIREVFEEARGLCPRISADDGALISEDEILRRSKEARRLHKDGKLPELRSLKDLLA